MFRNTIVFVGGFAVAYSETHDLKNSLRFASATAALNDTQKGAANANPTRQKVLDIFGKQLTSDIFLQGFFLQVSLN